MCTYSWFTSLYSRKWHNIVKQLYSNKKIIITLYELYLLVWIDGIYTINVNKYFLKYLIVIQSFGKQESLMFWSWICSEDEYGFFIGPIDSTTMANNLLIPLGLKICIFSIQSRSRNHFHTHLSFLPLTPIPLPSPPSLPLSQSLKL